MVDGLLGCGPPVLIDAMRTRTARGSDPPSALHRDRVRSHFPKGQKSGIIAHTSSKETPALKGPPFPAAKQRIIFAKPRANIGKTTNIYTIGLASWNLVFSFTNICYALRYWVKSEEQINGSLFNGGHNVM